MFGIIENFLGYEHNINTNMSHNVLNICIIPNSEANDINTNMASMAKRQMAKQECCHSQGGKQQLGLQAHEYGALFVFLL